MCDLLSLLLGHFLAFVGPCSAMLWVRGQPALLAMSSHEAVELKRVFTFPSDWKKSEGEQYSMTCENDMKFKFLCPQTKLRWNVAVLT